MYFIKDIKLLKTLASLTALLFLPGHLFGSIVFESATEGFGEVIVEGTSTLHDWEVKSEDIRGSLRISTSNFDLDTFVDSMIEAEFRIPVRSLTSDNRGMDRRMYNAMDVSDHEYVTFVLNSLRLVDSSYLGGLAESVTEGSIAVLAVGELTITGTSKDVEVPALIQWDGQQLRVETEKVIVMSEYGIEPPRALMGTIRTGDEVTVRTVWMPEVK